MFGQYICSNYDNGLSGLNFYNEPGIKSPTNLPMKVMISWSCMPCNWCSIVVSVCINLNAIGSLSWFSLLCYLFTPFRWSLDLGP